MAKIRKFREGSTVEDAEEAKFKAAGLAASNAELERGERKPSGFLGLGRFLQGNIDQKGSEAYNLYGAGYGREVEAKNDRLKAATLKKAADDEARDAAAARVAEDARSEARIKAADKKIADIKERAAAAESDYRGPMERRKLDVSEPAKAPAASTRSTGTAGASAKSSTVVDSRTAEAGNSRGSRAAEPADSRTAEAGNSRGSRAADPSKPASKPAAPAPAATPKETTEIDSKDSFADDITLSLAERRKRLAERLKRRSDSDKETQSKSVTERFKESFKAKGGAIQSYAKGGSVSASRRGDGIAQRGKTRGKMY